MSLVREGRRQRVFENSGCFIKTDAAASDVRRSLLGIPFELHRVSIRPSGGRPSSCRTIRLSGGATGPNLAAKASTPAAPIGGLKPPDSPPFPSRVGPRCFGGGLAPW